MIEDCAHSLGVEYKRQKIGSFGDASFFSFGRDKVISSVFGGAAIINAECRMQNAELKKIDNEFKYPNYFWILQQIFHPIAFAFILPLYNIAIGKVVLFLLLKLHLISRPVYNEEKRGEKSREVGVMRDGLLQCVASFPMPTTWADMNRTW